MCGRPMDEFATAWEQVTRSEYIDLLRTRLGFVDRARLHIHQADSFDRSSNLGLRGSASGVSKERSSRCADHAPSTTDGDRAHAFRPPPGFEAPSPFLHQLTSRVDGDNCEAWYVDSLRHTTRKLWRIDDVTAGDSLGSHSPRRQTVAFASRAMARTPRLSDGFAGMNRSGGEEESKRVNRDLS